MPANHNIPHTKESKEKISKAKSGVPLIKKRRVSQIIDGVAYWRCPSCRKKLPESDFYKTKRTWNGITNECKRCHAATTIRSRNPDNARRLNREYMARTRLAKPDEVRARDRLRPPASPEKVLARSTLNGAVKSGKIEKPEKCPKCGSDYRINGHHSDYDKPLDVEWVCPLCHAEIHRDLGVIF